MLLTVPEGTRSAMARVAPGGALAADDTRWAVAQNQRQYTALLVTEGNVFMEEALRLRSGLNLVLAGPQDAQAAAGCDLYIYDGVLPETLPETGSVWAVNPPEAVAGITPGEAVQGNETLRAAAGGEAADLCRHLLLSDVALRSFRPLSGGVPVLLAGGESLLACPSRKDGARRCWALTFTTAICPSRRISRSWCRICSPGSFRTQPLPWRQRLRRACFVCAGCARRVRAGGDSGRTADRFGGKHLFRYGCSRHIPSCGNP